MTGWVSSYLLWGSRLGRHGGEWMTLIWQLAGLAILPLAAYIGLKLPDIDQHVGFLLHRSIITHGPLFPLVAFLVAQVDNPLPRRFALGTNCGLAVHFAFDLFPKAWQGYALVSVPVYGWMPPVISWVILGGTLLLSMCLAIRGTRSGIDTGTLLLVVGASFWFAVRNENSVWLPMAVLVGSFVAAYWLIGPDKGDKRPQASPISP
jgi:hypothetical protein